MRIYIILEFKPVSSLFYILYGLGSNYLAMKAIKAEPREHRHEYQHRNGAAPPPPPGQKSAFYKLRSLAIIFKLRKVPRAQLKSMCKTLGVDYCELVCDMPVRWNSSDTMVSAGLQMELPLDHVLRGQKWDQSVRDNLTLDRDDWNTLRQMAIFFNIFTQPTIASQADQYPTLHNAIPDYLLILRQLNVFQLQVEEPILQIAAAAAYKVMKDYYEKSMRTRHSFVALICDPRFKMASLAFLFDAEGGDNSPSYRLAKAHFENVYSSYQKRARGIAEWKRQERENAAEDAERNVEIPAAGQEAWRTDPFDGWDAHRIQGNLAVERGPLEEIERWNAEGTIPRKSTPEQQRVYLQSRAYDFPIITAMARDFLAIPATSAPSERVFSMAGNLLSKKRTRISSENVRIVLCLRSWGLLVDADDEDEIRISEEGEIIRDFEVVDLE